MIQQQGYGQIYGNMGGAAVGASIYSAARENVTFARMVELQRLNLEKRRLRMQQAQVAANADLSRQRINMENTRLQLEARRLDMVDKQNEEQRLRAEKAYEAKMQELETRQQQEQAKAEQQAQAARLKREQQMFDNGMEVTRAGGNIMGVDGMTGDASYNYLKVPGSANMARVPVAQQRAVGTTQGQARGASGPTDNQAYRRVNAVVESDMKTAEKSLAEAKRQLSVMESRLQGMERDAASTDGTRVNEELEKYRGEVEAKRAEIEAQSGSSYDVAREYRDALAEDSSLAQDVPYTKWKSLPWKEYSGEQRTTLYNLLKDDTEDGRALLKSLVDRRDFNPLVANAWRSAREKLGDDLAMSPDEWMKKYDANITDDTPAGSYYKEELERDGTILMDVDYDGWKTLFDGLGMKQNHKVIFLVSLLQGEGMYDRELLSKLVSAGNKDFDLGAAEDWQKAAAVESSVARRIDPGVWMAVKWNDVGVTKKTQMEAYLQSDKEVDAELLGAILFKDTGKQALRAGAPLASAKPNEPVPQAAAEQPKEEKKQAAAEQPKPSGKLDNGIIVGTDSVKIFVNGRTRSYPREEWDKKTYAQRKEIIDLVNAKRKAAKGQGK